MVEADLRLVMLEEGRNEFVHESQGTPFSLNGKARLGCRHTGMVGSALVRRLQRENCEILKSLAKNLI